MSKRAIARHFGISRDSVDKMIVYSAPPGYRRTAPVKRPKLDGFTEIIDQWLEEHYAEQTLQTHVMAAYAERGLERMPEALRLTDDYFVLDREAFLRRWLPGKGTDSAVRPPVPRGGPSSRR
jgi:hypothetical protein